MTFDRRDARVRPLVCDLMSWSPGQDLRPILKEAVELLGAHVILDLSWDPETARAQLLARVETYLEIPSATGS